MTDLDKTFCASPNCTNACGRKMSEKILTMLKRLHEISDGIPIYIKQGYFCGEPLKDEATLAYEKIVKKYNKAIKNLADK